VAQLQLPYGNEDARVASASYGGWRPDYEFTGKEQDPDVGLMYFGARFFAPGLGRWASPDPQLQHWVSSKRRATMRERLAERNVSMQQNLYQYCVANPVSFLDSDGKFGTAYVERFSSPTEAGIVGTVMIYLPLPPTGDAVATIDSGQLFEHVTSVYGGEKGFVTRKNDELWNVRFRIYDPTKTKIEVSGGEPERNRFVIGTKSDPVIKGHSEREYLSGYATAKQSRLGAIFSCNFHSPEPETMTVNVDFRPVGEKMQEYVERTTVHEIGHLLGLNHVTGRPPDIMIGEGYVPHAGHLSRGDLDVIMSNVDTKVQGAQTFGVSEMPRGVRDLSDEKAQPAELMP
jgi:RHS repeat-associated protein